MPRYIADAVRRAMHNFVPARLAWGSGSLPQEVFCRRWRLKEGAKAPNPFGGNDQVKMNPGIANPDLLEPADATDPELSFLAVQTADGRPLPSSPITASTTSAASAAVISPPTTTAPSPTASSSSWAPTARTRPSSAS